MTISVYNPIADAQYAATLDRIQAKLSAILKPRAPKAVLNFGNRNHAFMVLWNPDKVERDYWQFSANFFGINFVYFGL